MVAGVGFVLSEASIVGNILGQNEGTRLQARPKACGRENKVFWQSVTLPNPTKQEKRRKMRLKW